MHQLFHGATIFTTLEVILERIYRLGGINLSEHNTKFLTSLMLQVAGATTMSVKCRTEWHTPLKVDLKKLVLDRELVQYIVQPPKPKSYGTYQKKIGFPGGRGFPHFPGGRGQTAGPHMVLDHSRAGRVYLVQARMI